MLISRNQVDMRTLDIGIMAVREIENVNMSYNIPTPATIPRPILRCHIEQAATLCKDFSHLKQRISLNNRNL